MTDPYPDKNADTTGTPRWLKVSGIIAALLVLLVIGMMLLLGGGEHRPSRHAPAGDGGGNTLPSNITETVA